MDEKYFLERFEEYEKGRQWDRLFVVFGLGISKIHPY